MRKWTPTLGAVTGAHETTFRVWAPERHSIELVFEPPESLAPESVGASFRWPMAAGGLKAASASGAFPFTFTQPGIRALRKDADGYWSATFTDLPAGTLYKYRLDTRDDHAFPDPASRFQPFGVHGPSQVVDAASFQWTDASWTAPSLDDTIFYELHVGTFTPEGTFRAAIERLAYLKRLGVTAIEIMPVADFPGERNWGYDGVAIFAPARCYGAPDDLRAFVDAAHAVGFAVYLDVVYNHLGPDGAYANAFSPYYFSAAHSSPWGAGVNLDSAHSAQVRRFFIENALHWVTEYHIDGLRLDATHALVDDSPTHFLAELTATVRAQADRPVTFVAEDHRNLSRMLEPVERGGFGIDAVWADDFHHQVRVHATGEREGYFADYGGSLADLATTVRQGWFYVGQPSLRSGLRRGTDPSSLTTQQFVVCIQNHDQVGNRADGRRLHHQIDPAVYRALSALLLLAPQTPLLFMGQEWAASSPFLFFTNHHDELGRQVTEGRRGEFAAFAAFRDAQHRAAIPDPQASNTFERSRLMWDELSDAPHAGVHHLYERLIALRRTLAPAQRMPAGARKVRPADSAAVLGKVLRTDAEVLDEHTIAIRRVDRIGGPVVLIARLSGGPADVEAPGDAPAQTLFTTEDDDVAIDPCPMAIDVGTPIRLRFTRPGAIVLGSPLAI